VKNISNKIAPAKQVMLSNLAAAGFGFITFFVLVRSLSLESFGEWVLYITAFNLAEMVRTGLVRQAMVHLSVSAQTKNITQAIRSSGFYLSLILSAVSGLFLFIIYLLFYANASSGIGYFFMLYPVVSILSLLPAFDIWVSQSKQQMLRMSALNLLPAIALAIIALGSLFISLTLLQIILLHGAIRVLLSLYSLVSNKTIRGAVFNPTFSQVKRLWHFGKYSVATLLGTNLLKSADNFLIGYFLGPAAVTLYNVPLKLLEIAEIPVRSSGQVFFPKFSALYANRKFMAFNLFWQQHVLKLMKWYLPVAVLAFFGAKYLVQAAGGAEMESSAIILQIFLFYVVLLPIDRLLGVAIDSTGRPKFNSLKVWVMVSLNIIGDIVVLR